MHHSEDAAHRLSLQGTFELAHAGALWTQIRAETAQLSRGERLDVDMSAVDTIDGASMAILVHLRGRLLTRGVETELVGAREHVQELIRLYEGDVDPTPRRRRKPESFLAQVGRSTIEFFREVEQVLGFLGATVRALLGILKEPKTGNWKAIMP